MMRRGLALAGILLTLLCAWLLTTDDTRVWPVRNTLQYRLLRASGALMPGAAGAEGGTLRGTVQGAEGTPIAGARVLVARRDGTTWSGRSKADGSFAIEGIAPGSYRPVAGAAGRGDVQLGGWQGVRVAAGQETELRVVLPVVPPRPLPPVEGLVLGDPQTLSCKEPLASRATRRAISFRSGGRASQPTFLYTPVTATLTSTLPTLLAVYPGPVSTWECVSIPLAAPGYAILAAGPAYSLELERDIDELEQLLALARAGQLPGADGTRVAALGGSYSALLVQRLIERDADLDAGVLLGAPTDLFDMRRRFEDGSFFPPFGLDRALVALGLPDQEPLRYWRYSGSYHTRPDMPPIALFHSRQDDIVPYQQSETLDRVLAEEGVEHELHLFDAGSHYLLSGDKDALAIYRLTLDFLARHLAKPAG